MGDTVKNWMIRRNGELEGPYAEYEIRQKLNGADLRGCEVRQGDSVWFPASTVLAKFIELARAGIYFRSDDEMVGPFTAARALVMLRSDSGSNVDVKVGVHGSWIAGEIMLGHLERLVTAASQTAVVQETPQLASGKRFESAGPMGALSGPRMEISPNGHYATSGYPRLPTQQRPMMYFLPGAFIALWGFVAFIDSLIGLFSGSLGVMTIATLVIPADAVNGLPIRTICNVVFLTLYLIMTLGSVSMIMRRDLHLARASAVLATIPCVGCLVMPFGIWACVSLFTREAERDFS
jgi:hypothetical protein